MYEVDFSLWIHVSGTAELDFKPETPDDLTDYIFSDECNCEILGIVKDPSFCGRGYMDVTPLDDEDDEDDEED